MTIAPFMKLLRQRKDIVAVAEQPEYAVAMHVRAGKNMAEERKGRGGVQTVRCKCIYKN